MVLINGQWEIEDKLGEGSFGDVYSAVDITTGALVAIKREKINGGSISYLENENKLYKELGGNVGVPKIYFYGEAGQYKVLVMERLGFSLKQWLQWAPGGRLPLRTVVYLTEEMLRRLRYVHSKGIVFRDIKPDQFCVGKSGEDIFSRPITYLIDFGLSQKYVDEFGKHVKDFRAQRNRPKTGTARYASINVHKGRDHARRDDLESLCYVIIEMAIGKLPWAGVQAKSSQDGWRKVCIAKEDTDTYELCSTLPDAFYNMLEYSKRLRFHEAPDYERLIHEFERLFSALGDPSAPLEWTPTPQLKRDEWPSPDSHVPNVTSYNSNGSKVQSDYYRNSASYLSYQSYQSAASPTLTNMTGPPSPMYQTYSPVQSPYSPLQSPLIAPSALRYETYGRVSPTTTRFQGQFPETSARTGNSSANSNGSGGGTRPRNNSFPLPYQQYENSSPTRNHYLNPPPQSPLQNYSYNQSLTQPRLPSQFSNQQQPQTIKTSQSLTQERVPHTKTSNSSLNRPQQPSPSPQPQSLPQTQNYFLKIEKKNTMKRASKSFDIPRQQQQPPSPTSPTPPSTQPKKSYFTSPNFFNKKNGGGSGNGFQSSYVPTRIVFDQPNAVRDGDRR
ncbi:hypothetical protein HK098_007561, partial [Nowakowskiella sp. JEL0407]